jgi:hypothetical protein
VCATVLCPLEAAAQTQIDWTRVRASGPSSRIDTSMVYDSVAGKLIMFGGYDQTMAPAGDIWEYDGATKKWTNVSPSSGTRPPALQGSAMAYDPVSRSVIMFGGTMGGSSGAYLATTYGWNTVTRAWTSYALPSTHR